MEVRIPKELFQALSKILKKKPFEIDDSRLTWHDYINVNLRRFPVDALKTLRTALADHLSLRGANGLYRDIATWIEAAKNPKGVKELKARKVRHGCDLLIEYLKSTKRKLLYKRVQEGAEGVTLAYYVEEITYHPPVKRGDYTEREYIRMKMHYEEFGVGHKESTSFHAEDVLTLTPHEILHRQGYMVENHALRSDYESFLETYGAVRKAIGKQFLAVGLADDHGIDGNEKDDDRGWWRSSRGTNLILDKDGEPSRVVIDVFKESTRDMADETDEGEDKANPWFWNRLRRWSAEGEEEEADDEELELEAEELEEMIIPIHPYVACFDLKRHKRLRIHVGNLSEYVYEKGIRERLILPESSSKLIDTLLVEKESHFKDVVRGKSGGTIILCQGPPGTGKTLTAEIYAEATERALYTVQCAQLGTNPEELEDELLKVLARGRRWGAIILLDEADVYVHERGNDLVQNAVVGVFLRVLEYQPAVLFLTTNRGDLVDDAILSRCTARIPYTAPTAIEQARIWRVLADANEIKLSDRNIREITKAHSNLSGRDVKNLLKLASLLAHDRDCPIDAELVGEVRRFKPTTDFFARKEGK